MTLDAIIFDLDGLLIDTERHSQQAFTETAAAYGLTNKADLFLSLVGTTEEAHRNRLAEELEPDINAVEFRRDWNDRYHQSISDEPPVLLPGVLDILEWLKLENIKRAVATSSKTKDGEEKLTNAGIRDYFPVVICGDQVSRSKPYPDIYLKAAESIEADVSRSLGIEDSANGVRAAHAAGLNVIQIPNLVPPSEELSQLGHRVCSSMTEVLKLVKSGQAIPL